MGIIPSCEQFNFVLNFFGQSEGLNPGPPDKFAEGGGKDMLPVWEPLTSSRIEGLEAVALII